MNYIIITLIILTLAVLGYIGYPYIKKLFGTDIPRAQQTISDVDELVPKLKKTYERICSEGVTFSAKKGAAGSYDLLGGDVPSKDVTVNLKIPCN